jgi:hypothetical protein
LHFKIKRNYLIFNFSGEVSPDGRSEDELSVAIVLDHPGIPKVLALVVDDTQHILNINLFLQKEKREKKVR